MLQSLRYLISSRFQRKKGWFQEFIPARYSYSGIWLIKHSLSIIMELLTFYCQEHFLGTLIELPLYLKNINFISILLIAFLRDLLVFLVFVDFVELRVIWWEPFWIIIFFLACIICKCIQQLTRGQVIIRAWHAFEQALHMQLKKIWLSIHRRNFVSELMVYLSVCPSAPYRNQCQRS